jgi:DNA polymerase-3 subunit delta
LTLVLGEEELLRARAITSVLRAAPDADVAELAVGDWQPGALAEASTPSLFAERRVVLLRGAEAASKALVDELRALLEAASPELSVVVEHRGGAKGKSLVTLLRQAGAEVVECPPLRRSADREAFAAAEVRRLGATATSDALSQLAEVVGGGARELASACAQLVADSGGRLDTDVVARHYRGHGEVGSFVIADRVVDGDTAGALAMLRWALATGVAPVLVTGAVASNLRAMGRVAEYRRESSGAAASRLGMPAWKVRKAQDWLRRWRPEGLRAAVRLLAAADAAVKGGSANASYALERAVIDVSHCAEADRKGRR